jgi:nitrate reductase delta subunit
MSAPHASVWQVLSLLLLYPDAEARSRREELAAAAAGLSPSAQREAIVTFLAHWRTADPLELQCEYVETFDFNKRATLYLSFFAYGDRRQRGMAMLRLKQRYRAAGFTLADGELPDYLPVLLEFTALAGELAGLEVLSELRPALELVRAALHEQRSRYATLLDAVSLGLPALSAEEAENVRELVLQGPPSEEVGAEPFAPPEVMPTMAPCRAGGSEPARRGEGSARAGLARTEVAL